MSDLSYIDRTDEVKIVGQDSTGNRVNYVGADANGNLTTKDAADGTPGSAVPSTAIQVGGTDGTNLRAIKTDSGGQPIVNQGVPNTAANKWPVSVTDGTNTQTVKAASTPAAAADPSAVVALSPNSPLPSGTNPIGTVKAELQDNSGTAITLGQKAMASSVPVVIASDQTHFPVEVQDGSGNAITSASNNNASPNQMLHVQRPDTVTVSTALGALNAVVTISMAGLSSVGLQLSAGTLIGTIQAQSSLDGGTTWQNVPFYDPSNSTVSNSIIFGSSNGLKILSILPVGGSSHVQVKVTAYTSGTANSILRASNVSAAAGAVTAAAYGTIANTFPATGANTATQILAANVNRKYAYISNGTGTACTIQFGSGTGLSTTTGILIPAKGFYELKGDNLFTGAVFAFAASNITLSVGEGTP